MTRHEPTAIVLLSGGLDSSTCMGIAADEGFEIIALSFDYGQRHRCELEASRRLVRHYRARRHMICELGLFRELGGSALTDDGIPVPVADSVAQIGEGIPTTYVPARNLVFLSYAVGLAEVEGASTIFIGVNAVDYSGYPDCRPEFIQAFAEAAGLAIKAGVEGRGPSLRTPLIDLSKAEIIAKGRALGVPYELTHSCYHPREDGTACGRCDSCLLRRKGFADAGLCDPIPYASSAA
ncbi:MAG: 7-cyano-7-deazaguanine synthase QueC [Myxococcales bacterium]|nr:7-cyano-7-deazaguanine synthase QueC [Myxococcales bacterium]MCB9717630.1 7-cyano-7-deazaguanine synthase QueC [Myxococcales bacterium]